MNAKEKYEIILKTIEQLIVENELSNREIGEKAFDNANLPMTDRERNVLFEFLIGKKVLQYISDRRLMIGYKYLMSEPDKKKAYKKALDISGSSNQSGYITKFKKMFGITPDVARDRDESSLYKAIPTWECLSGDEEEKSNNMVETVFGVPRSQFKILQEAMNLQDFYSLNEKESEFAYSLYKSGIDMEKAFEYLADYLVNNDSEDRDIRLDTDLTRGDVKYLYFDCDFGFDEIFVILLMQGMKQFKHPIVEYDKRFFEHLLMYIRFDLIYDSEDYKVPFEEKYDYFIESSTDMYTDVDLDLYTFYSRFFEYKEAFSKIKPGKCNRNDYERIVMMRKQANNEDEHIDYYYDDDYQDEYHYTSINSGIIRETEPELWDENYVDYEDEYENYDDFDDGDDDSWMARELEGPEYDVDEHVIIDMEEARLEEEFFDVDEFERICQEMSDSYDEDGESEKKSRKGFVIYKDLNVEEFMKDGDKNHFFILV